jgi:hypothetical protein
LPAVILVVVVGWEPAAQELILGCGYFLPAHDSTGGLFLITF